MLKKNFKHIFERWQKLDEGVRKFISLLLLAAIITCSMFIFVDLSFLNTDDETYDALTEVAYNIIKTKDVTQPLSGELHFYNVYFNSDGTIEIELFGKNSEIVELTLSSDFKLKSLERDSVTVNIFFGLVILLSTYCVYWVICFILFIIKKVYKFFKNLNSKSKQE